MQPEEDRPWPSRVWPGEHEVQCQPSIPADSQSVKSPEREQALRTWHFRETTAFRELRSYTQQHPSEVQERVRQQVEEEKDEEEHMQLPVNDRDGDGAFRQATRIEGRN